MVGLGPMCLSYHLVLSLRGPPCFLSCQAQLISAVSSTHQQIQVHDKKSIFDEPLPTSPGAVFVRSLGITRLTVYSGLAGFYLLRKKGIDSPELKGIPFPPLGSSSRETNSTQIRELPIVMQDRAFCNDTGKFWYPVNDIPGPGQTNGTLPDGPYAPFWVPEFFPSLPQDATVPAAVMVINGKSWPRVVSPYCNAPLNGTSA